MNLFVFPTNRALNDFYINYKSSILPDATTIKGFFDEVIIIDKKTKIPKHLRKIILWDIIDEFEVKKIGFDKTFLRFLENSSFLFNFFDEIESALIDIKDIDSSDTYGDYEDHLRIINKIYNAYKQRLDDLNLYDNATSYRLNTAYLKYYKNIDIYIDGLVSNKDFSIIKSISNITNINLIFECSRYNTFIFDKLFDYKFKPQMRYTININTNKITNQITIQTKKPKISLYSFSIRLNQALLVIAKINEWLKEGADNIIVVLPSEDFKRYLKLFDKAKNLNYAMGLEDTNTIAKLENLKENLNIDSTQSKLQNIINNLNNINKDIKDELLELSSFSTIFEKLEYKEILDFIISNIKNLDDISGGKVKVIGILETRGIDFDKVIIVDFNDDFLPKINDDDIFLNSSIRKKINLPTIKDKENLQRHYYTKLINNANEVCIAFCSNTIHSSLIDDLELNASNAIEGENIWSFFPQSNEKEYIEDIIIADYTDSTLSVTKINDFLSCKRKFYFLNIAKLKPKDKNENAFLGSTIHSILKDLHNDFTMESFRNEINKREINILDKVDLETTLYKIEPFINKNYKMLQNGREILHREFPFECEIFGFNFKGIIDRIDRYANKIYIIDYKIKNNFIINNENYLQLLVYKKAIHNIYKDYVIEAMYYDVLNNKVYYMKPEDEEAQESILKETISLFKNGNINFEKTNSSSICHYCNYKYLCNVY